MAERRAVELAGEAAAGEADQQPQCAADRQVCAPSGSERPDRAVEAERVARRAIEDHELSLTLRRDGLTDEIEGGLERRMHGGNDDREVLAPAAGEHVARSDPLERGLAERRRHLAQR